jgi:AcrR family transcriptional regulator
MPFYYTNMFKQEIARGKSKETRASILSHAIRLFRERGFDATTMRDVADAAGVALGSAYYYFPGKEAIVQAYYDEVQSQHLSQVAEALGAKKHNFEERLRIAFHAKFDILAHDRKLLGALFRYTADPTHPLSVFGPANQATREQSMSVFALAIGEEKLPEDIRAAVPIALWALHMGILLYFIYDQSLGQERTRKLIDGAVRIIVRILSVARLPIMKPLRGSLVSLLRGIDLLPESQFHGASMREER